MTTMIARMLHKLRRAGTSVLAAAAIGSLAAGAPAHAQDVESVDPDDVYSAPIDGDLASPEAGAPPAPLPGDPGVEDGYGDYAPPPAESPAADIPATDPAIAGAGPVVTEPSATYAEDDLIGAAEGVFGKGAEGLARLIEDLLEKQGKPNAYIVGREAGGAFIVGARYGSGTLHHKVEGTQQVYWTGPSIGLDAGANAANTFVLVYNLYDTQDLFERFPAGEGQAYFIGGLHASYLRRGDIVLIPIRMGAGLRLGINAGYMRFSKEQRWLPF